MDENKTTCPCCPNQCEAGALQCGKGRAYFRNEDNGGSERSNRNESEHNHHQGEGRLNHGGRRELGEHRRGRSMEAHGRNCEMGERRHGFVIEEKLQGQLRACGHFLHYNMGQKVGQARILSVLLERGTITQRELQDILEVRSGSLSEILNKVEADGFIERSQSENDRRQMEVKLTEAGTEAASRLEEERGDMTSGLFSCLSGEEKKTLAELLDKLLDGWEGPERERGCRDRGHGRRMHGREAGQTL